MSRSISIWNAKGGVGKTMLALQVAGAYAAAGLRVSLIDCDPQGSALVWSSLAARQERETQFTVTASKSPGFDLYIYDHQPTATENLMGDVVVIPTLLDAASMIVSRRSERLALDKGLPVFLVPNRVRTDRKEQRDVITMLEEKDSQLCQIRDRAIFANAYGTGRTIFDSAFNAKHKALAVREIDSVTKRIDALLSNENNHRRAAA